MDEFKDINNVTNFDEVRNKFNSHIQKSAQVWKAVNALQELNAEYLTSLAGTHRQIKEITNIADLGRCSNFNYVELKDKYDKLCVKYKEIEEINKSLESTHSLCMQKLIDTHNTEIENIKAQLLEKESELKNIRIDKKNNADAKEHEHLEELNKCQLAASIKYTEMEKGLQKAINDANSKLRELSTSNNTLRSELVNYKSQYHFTVNNNEKDNIEKIQRLEVKLLYAENQLKEKRKLFENCHTNVIKFASKKTKYTYTNNQYSKQCAADAEQQLRERTGLGEESNNKFEISVKKENIIEKPSEPNIVKFNEKKRKLFNPNDLDYLNYQF